MRKSSIIERNEKKRYGVIKGMFKVTEGLIRKNYMTTQEASESLKVSPIRIRQLCTEGRLKGAFSFGSTWLIPKESVGKFERHTRGKSREG